MRLLSVILLGFYAAPLCTQPAPASPLCLDLVEPYRLGEVDPPDSAFTLHLDPAEGGMLYYLGARHSDDPSDAQFAHIEAVYLAVRPTVVFYEGPERPLGATAETTIRAYGESGYVRWLAAQYGASVARLEPASPAIEFATVAEAVGAEQAALFFVLREAARLRDRKGLQGDTLRAAVAGLLERARPLGLPFATTTELNEAYVRHFTVPARWEDVPGAWFDPAADDVATGGRFMAEANRASSHTRDRHMVRVLADAVGRGERVLAVVGRHHLPKQAAALRCLLGDR